MLGSGGGGGLRTWSWRGAVCRRRRRRCWRRRIAVMGIPSVLGWRCRMVPLLVGTSEVRRTRVGVVGTAVDLHANRVFGRGMYHG